MEQQVAAMFQEVQLLRQMLVWQEQRHAHEIQQLQDKATTTKPNHRRDEQLQELQAFQRGPRGAGRVHHQVPQSDCGRRWRCGCAGGKGRNSDGDAQVIEKDWNILSGDRF